MVVKGDSLDDNYFIFHDMTFELFHIENLVISTRGIFVVAKIREKEPLHVENDVLYAGDTPLDTLTGNVWRICHLINIVYKKTYKEEIMPKVEVFELAETIQSYRARLAEIEKNIQSAVNQKPVILEYMESIQKDLDYHTVLAGVGSIEELAYLQGFVRWSMCLFTAPIESMILT